MAVRTTAVLKAALALFLTTSFALASQDQSYGLGGTTSARVSAVIADTTHPYAALYNPALLAAQAKAGFGFSTLTTSTQFEAVPGLENRSATLWAAGVSLPTALSFWPEHHAGFGLVVSGPYGNLRRFAAGAPTDFYSLRYGTADHQFKATISGSLELIPRHLFLGIGASLFISGSGAADAAIVSTNPTARLLLDVGLNTAVVAGLYSDWEKTRAALVYRQEIHPYFQQSFTGRVQWGDQDILQQPILLTSSLYYEPHTLELEAQREVGPVTLSFGVSYQHWSEYKPSYLVIETTDATGRVNRPELPKLSFHNTLSPRFSVDVPLSGKKLSVAAGYQLRPTPVADLSGGANIVDTDAHLFGLGLRYRLDETGFLPWATTWSLFGQMHQMVGREVKKTETRFNGSPGYRIAGASYVAGLSVQAEL